MPITHHILAVSHEHPDISFSVIPTATCLSERQAPSPTISMSCPTPPREPFLPSSNGNADDDRPTDRRLVRTHI